MFSGGELQRSFNIPAKPIDFLEILHLYNAVLGVQDAVREPAIVALPMRVSACLAPTAPGSNADH
jgi:hypothetical protein